MRSYIPGNRRSRCTNRCAGVHLCAGIFAFFMHRKGENNAQTMKVGLALFVVAALALSGCGRRAIGPRDGSADAPRDAAAADMASGPVDAALAEASDAADVADDVHTNDAPDDAGDADRSDVADASRDVTTPPDATTDVPGPICPRPTKRDPPSQYPLLSGPCEHVGDTCGTADYCCVCSEVPSCGWAWLCGFVREGPGCPPDEPTLRTACVPKDIGGGCNYCPGGMLHAFRCAADGIWVESRIGCAN